MQDADPSQAGREGARVNMGSGDAVLPESKVRTMFVVDVVVPAEGKILLEQNSF